MKLHELTYNDGARTTRKRVGRGHGSGLGKLSGRGQTGQNSRSGGGVAIGFEGGQTPLYRRLPKRGFNNKWRVEYTIVNLDALEQLEDNTEVTLESLLELGVVKKQLDGLKVLGQGNLTKKLVVKANKFSESAKTAIEKAGGKAEVI